MFIWGWERQRDLSGQENTETSVLCRSPLGDDGSNDAWRPAFHSLTENKSHTQRMQVMYACIFLQILGKVSKTPDREDCGRERTQQSEALGSHTSPSHVCFPRPHFPQLQNVLVWTPTRWWWYTEDQVGRGKKTDPCLRLLWRLSRKPFFNLHYHLGKSQTTDFSFPVLSTVAHTSP